VKKLLLGLVLLILLTSCEQGNHDNVESSPTHEIKTYKEVIKDGKVEIDGISYDIQSVTKITNTYDDNENIIEKITANDNSETRIELLYENNKVIEDRGYSNRKLRFTTYYYYEDNLLIKKKTVHESGLETSIEYSYEDKTEMQTHYNSDSSISFISTAYLDDDGNILKNSIANVDGEVTGTTTFYYENELLIKGIREKEGKKIASFNYEYNKFGDKILEYNILSGIKDNVLIAMLYDIEYDENLLPKTVTIYRVQSLIAEEDIRDY
jgi:antitoxin component YwqK of YwqJK toxin-antitoxin module